MNPKKIFICPNCGEIKKCKIIKTFKKELIFNNVDELIDSTPYTEIGQDQPVCLHCGTKVIVIRIMENLRDHVPDMRLRNIGLSTRAFNAITRGVLCHISSCPSTITGPLYDPTVLDVVMLVKEKDLRNAKGLGAVTYQEIMTKFAEYGIHLQKE